MKTSVLTTILFVLLTLAVGSQSLPEGFSMEKITDDVDFPLGLLHTNSSISYIWTQNGKLLLMEDHQVRDKPVLDISDEVGFWADHGMLGAALDPKFNENGWIYLLYVVDRHHLLYSGSPDYDPDKNEYQDATIARITRYQIDTESMGRIVPGSRHIIIGSTIESGIPITTKSHGIGTLLFGYDGSLLFSVGDGSAPGKDFVGEAPIPEAAFDPQALEDGILREEENIGAYRSQYLNSYCGKILRIDPATGKGMEDNPFYDSTRPQDPKSKVWALGLRNPFRMNLVPKQHSPNQNTGPGIIIIGDVGDWSWEEINVADEPGLNFGWPVYQGQVSYYLFRDKEVSNRDAAINIVQCERDFFYFKELIEQPRKDHTTSFTHPCNTSLAIPDDIPVFVHQRPVLSYSNWISDTTITEFPGYDDQGNAFALSIGNNPELIAGDDFNGSSSIGGTFYSSDGYPEEYRNLYFQGDFNGWFRAFRFDQNFQVTAIENWGNNVGNIVHISENPFDQSLYLVTYDLQSIFKVSYEGNLKPVIVSTPDTIFGGSPLTVTFDASESYDPEGDSLSFHWDFGHGENSINAVEVKSFESPDGLPISFPVKLTVTDGEGAASVKNILVSVNNTPPVIDITSILPGDKYHLDGITEWPLEATVSDKEHSSGELSYDWRVFLHHNTHFHQEAIFTNPTGLARIEPLGCGIETYYYRIRLSVTDPMGLVTTQERIIHPDCERVKPDVNIYPNPANQELNLSFGRELGNVNIFIHGFEGKLYYKTSMNIRENENINLHLPSLKAGSYFIQVLGKNFRIRKKLVLGM